MLLLVTAVEIKRGGNDDVNGDLLYFINLGVL